MSAYSQRLAATNRIPVYIYRHNSDILTFFCEPSTVDHDMMIHHFGKLQIVFYLFRIFIRIFHILRTGSGCVAWDSNFGLQHAAGPFLSSWVLVLCQPSPGRAALVRPQKSLCQLGRGHDNLQSSHSSCPPPPVAGLQDCATSPG